jgi:hypothetical protein
LHVQRQPRSVYQHAVEIIERLVRREDQQTADGFVLDLQWLDDRTQRVDVTMPNRQRPAGLLAAGSGFTN